MNSAVRLFAHRWLLAAICLFAVGNSAHAQVSIAQLSDTHIGEPRAPHAAENLRRAVDMINQRHPDAVILTGDIGENPEAWQQAKSILKGLQAPLYYVPGNHDVHTHDVQRYRDFFGKDYYTFRVQDITFVVIDSQLLGNYDHYEAKTPLPLPPDTKAESDKMFAWLQNLADHKPSGTIIGVQHIAPFRDHGFPDPKPYWVVDEPYRWREVDLLHKLAIKHVLVGHWHNGRVFQQADITWHVAPATSWLPWGGELGFAIHHIRPDGDVETEFIPLAGAIP